MKQLTKQIDELNAKIEDSSKKFAEDNTVHSSNAPQTKNSGDSLRQSQNIGLDGPMPAEEIIEMHHVKPTQEQG